MVPAKVHTDATYILHKVYHCVVQSPPRPTCSICWHHLEASSSKVATVSGERAWLMQPSDVFSLSSSTVVSRERYTASSMLF